jgi:DNA-directed RNA polymerase specialized sigma24 family protein
MSVTSQTDKKMDVLQFRASEEYRAQWCNQLYKNIYIRRSVEKTVLYYGGNTEDAEDVFQDCIVALFNRIFKDVEFSFPENISAYFSGMARNIYLSKIKSASRMSIAESEFASTDFEQNPVVKNCGNFAELIYSQSTESCKRVLMYWSAGYKMMDIAKMMNYKSDMMARKKKHECLQKLIRVMKGNPAMVKKILNDE